MIKAQTISAWSYWAAFAESGEHCFHSRSRRPTAPPVATSACRGQPVWFPSFFQVITAGISVAKSRFLAYDFAWAGEGWPNLLPYPSYDSNLACWFSFALSCLLQMSHCLGRLSDSSSCLWFGAFKRLSSVLTMLSRLLIQVSSIMSTSFPD